MVRQLRTLDESAHNPDFDSDFTKISSTVSITVIAPSPTVNPAATRPFPVHGVYSCSCLPSNRTLLVHVPDCPEVCCWSKKGLELELVIPFLLCVLTTGRVTISWLTFVLHRASLSSFIFCFLLEPRIAKRLAVIVHILSSKSNTSPLAGCPTYLHFSYRTTVVLFSHLSFIG